MKAKLLRKARKRFKVSERNGRYCLYGHYGIIGYKPITDFCNKKECLELYRRYIFEYVYEYTLNNYSKMKQRFIN